MKRGLTAGAVGAVLAWALLVVRPADGQQPAPLAEGGSMSTWSTTEADAAAPPAPTSPAPSVPPGYMLVPVPADAGQPDAKAPVDVSAALASGVGTNMARFRYANTWDLNIEGGGGYVFGDTDKWSGFVRVRPGALIVRNDSFYQIGATAEYLGMLKRPAFGLQAEYLHLQLGTWMQVGGSIDTKARPGANVAVGLSIFGVEAQVREFDASPDPAFALIGKIRLPLGILVYGIRTKK